MSESKGGLHGEGATDFEAFFASCAAPLYANCARAEVAAAFRHVNIPWVDEILALGLGTLALQESSTDFWNNTWLPDMGLREKKAKERLGSHDEYASSRVMINSSTMMNVLAYA